MKLSNLLFALLFLTSSLTFAQKTIKHIVSEGETIYSIANKYLVKERSIYRKNKKTKKKPLQVNQVLEIPYSRKYAKMVKKNNKRQPKKKEEVTQTHKVVKGETLYQISRNYGVSVDELKKLNPEVVSSLPVGYPLKLKGNSSTTNTKITSPKKKSSKKTASKTATLIKTSYQYLGTKYRNGGTTKKGLDCSGLMLVTYKDIHMNLPRTVSEQVKVGKKIKKSKAQKGDLIFFATGRKKRINHVGMITQVNGSEIQFIHASTSLGVIISSTKEAYYSKRFVQVNSVL